MSQTPGLAAEPSAPTTCSTNLGGRYVAAMTTPAGWYPDPSNEPQVRFWDGSRWTEYRAPNEIATQVTAANGPVREAADSKLRREAFFQLVLPVSEIKGYSNELFRGGNGLGGLDASHTTSKGGHGGLLGAIESLGWRLEHAGWVFVETGASSRDRSFASGQKTSTSGRIDGIYLFRSTDIPQDRHVKGSN